MGFKEEIADALELAIKQVTIANGYSLDVQTVTSEVIKLNLADYKDSELPAAQIIVGSQVFKHKMSRSKSTWTMGLELCLRSTQVLGEVNQRTLWNFCENVRRAVMKTPNLGLNYVQHVRLTAEVTDLHLQQPNYTAIISIEVLFYEPIVRDNC